MAFNPNQPVYRGTVAGLDRIARAIERPDIQIGSEAWQQVVNAVATTREGEIGPFTTTMSDIGPLLANQVAQGRIREPEAARALTESSHAANDQIRWGTLAMISAAALSLWGDGNILDVNKILEISTLLDSGNRVLRTDKPVGPHQVQADIFFRRLSPVERELRHEPTADPALTLTTFRRSRGAKEDWGIFDVALQVLGTQPHKKVGFSTRYHGSDTINITANATNASGLSQDYVYTGKAIPPYDHTMDQGRPDQNAAGLEALRDTTRHIARLNDTTWAARAILKDLTSR